MLRHLPWKKFWVVGVALLLSACTLQVQKPEAPVIEKEMVNWKTYRNEKYGFEFQYPQNYFLTEENPYFIRIQDNEEAFDNGIEIDISQDHETTSQAAFKRFVVEKIQKDCANRHDALPTVPVFCTGVKSIESFKNSHENTGYRIFIKEKSYSGQERERGPVFVFDISQHTQNKARGIYFERTITDTRSVKKEIFLTVLNNIVSTFRLTTKEEYATLTPEEYAVYAVVLHDQKSSSPYQIYPIIYGGTCSKDLKKFQSNTKTAQLFPNSIPGISYILSEGEKRGYQTTLSRVEFTSKENEAVVGISSWMGTFGSDECFFLQKQNGVWQIEKNISTMQGL